LFVASKEAKIFAICQASGIMFIRPARPTCLQIGQADFALDVGIRTLEYFTDIFKIPYALDKLDFVAVPNFWPGGAGLLSMLSFYLYGSCAAIAKCTSTSLLHVTAPHTRPPLRSYPRFSISDGELGTGHLQGRIPLV
jgi:hypothetical protein